MPDLTLFLSRSLEEEMLVAFFEREIGIPCESLQLGKASAFALVSCIAYSDGYPMGVSLAWPASIAPGSVTQLAVALSRAARVSVLFEGEESESETPAEQWFLVEPPLQDPRPVRILELPDGICPADT